MTHGSPSGGLSLSYRTTEEASVIPIEGGSRGPTRAAPVSGTEQKHVSIKSPVRVGAGSKPPVVADVARQRQQAGDDGGDVYRAAKLVDDQLRHLEQLVRVKRVEKEEADMKVAIKNSLVQKHRQRRVKAPLASPVLQKPPLAQGPAASPVGQAARVEPTQLPLAPPECEGGWSTFPVGDPAPVVTPEATGSVELGRLVEIQTQAAALALMKESRPKEKYNGGKKWAFVKQMKAFIMAVEHPSISDRHKLHEIQHYFGGSAFKLVEAETFKADAAAAFESAMNRLTLKFGMRRETPMDMMEEVLQGKAVAEKDPNALLDFYTKILSIHTYALEEGRLADFDSKMLVEAVLQKKLPHLALKWSKKAVKHLNDTGEELLFDAFLSFVDQEHCISEMMQRMTKTAGQQKQQPSYAKVASTNVGVSAKQKGGAVGPPVAPGGLSSSTGGSVASAGISSPVPGGSSSTLASSAGAKCSRCGADHGLADCPVFSGMEVKDRREFCRNIQACYRCMSTGHISKWCKEGISCDLCKRQHHTMLHTEVSAPSTAAVAAAAAAAAAAGGTPVAPEPDA